MGTDIHGYVEVVAQPWDKRWTRLMNIEPLVQRHYPTFSKLFGVRRYGSEISIACRRGIPEDADPRFFRHLDDGTQEARTPGDDCTWIGYDELEPTFGQIEYPESWSVLFKIMTFLNSHYTPEIQEGETVDDYWDDLKIIYRPCYCRLIVWFDS